MSTEQQQQLEQLSRLLKQKMSKMWYAERLNITVEEVNELLQELKSPRQAAPIQKEESSAANRLLSEYGIDASLYPVQSGWIRNKDISVQFSKVQEDSSSILEGINKIIKEFDFKYEPKKELLLNTTHSDKTCAVLSLQDLHIGKATLDNRDSIVSDTKECIESLINRAASAYNLEKIIFVLGGDLLNMDTYLGTTASQKTFVDNNMTAYDAYKIAFDLMFWAINYLNQHCNILEVIYIPGNHSKLTEAHIAYAMSRCIVEPSIIWDIAYAERKVTKFGNSMICFEHGDFDTKKSPLTFAIEYPSVWGKSKYRVLYTGHYHKNNSSTIRRYTTT